MEAALGFRRGGAAGRERRRGSGLTYRAAGKGLGVRARDYRGEIPGGDRGGALRGGAEEGDDRWGLPVSGAMRAVSDGGGAGLRSELGRGGGRPQGGPCEAGPSA